MKCGYRVSAMVSTASRVYYIQLWGSSTPSRTLNPHP